MVAVEDGRDGLLLVSSLIGAGSTYINYMIGDLAFKTKAGFRDINRASPNPDIANSCAEDALAV